MEKQYKLLQWYPSLSGKLKAGMTVEFNGRDAIRLNEGNTEQNWQINSFELQDADFWEEIKESLFVTDDKVNVYDKRDIIHIVTRGFETSNSQFENIYDKSNRKDFKYFYFEKNAIKYIEMNKPKPLLTTEDGVEVFDRDQELYSINKNTFKKGSLYAYYSGINDYYVFYSELNRDNYFWRNKRVFSYEDFIEHAYNKPKFRRDIEEIAKERCK